MLMATLVALLQMSTECGSATLDDVLKGSALLARKQLSIGLEKAGTKSSEDIRQFQMWPAHGVGVGSGSTEGLGTSRSRGLVVERNDSVETCR